MDSSRPTAARTSNPCLTRNPQCPETNKTVTLPAIGWEIIRALLRDAGWCTTPRDIFIAGSIDTNLDTALPEKPKPGKDGKIDPKKDDAWSEKPVKVELMGKEIDVIAKALKAAVARGGMGAGKLAVQLVKEFLPEEC